MCKNQFASTFSGGVGKKGYNHIKYNELFKSGMSNRKFRYKPGNEELVEHFGGEESLVNIIPVNMGPSPTQKSFPLSARNSSWQHQDQKYNFMQNKKNSD